MYYDFLVKVPVNTGKINLNRRGDTRYVEYTYDRIYNPEKKYNVPKRTTIGKLSSDDDTKMYPNQNFRKYFPDAELPDEKPRTLRSSCLSVGPYLVISKIVREYGLDEMIKRIIGKDSGLFLDLAAYSIIEENNAAQYYPDYAFRHPLFTHGMKIYSDSKVSEFIGSVTSDQSIGFLNDWNASRDHRERIYVSYDSTNKNCQAGDIEIAEFGHAKDNKGQPIINYSIAYDRTNREPLFYESYPGSIVDISQLQYTIEKVQSYGYRHLGFILDRGYFSRENIRHMDKCGYDFVIMMKGQKEIAKQLVMEKMGTFEDTRATSIRKYRLNGTTIKKKLFPSDENDRYFHLYYSSSKYSAEKEAVESKIDRLAETFSKYEGMDVQFPASSEKYFDLIYYHEGRDDQKFMYAKEKTDVIDEEISLCGYFVIITSEKMTAAEAIDLYKSRDASEKLFRGDKSYLGNRSLRVHSAESAEAKIFIEFVALIIRSRIYTSLKDAAEGMSSIPNYMNVPAALKELGKIEMIRHMDDIYRLDHAVTKTQKTILKAFGIDAGYIKEKVKIIGDTIAYHEEGKQHGEEKHSHR